MHWTRIEPGSDLIPLGASDSFESHICYGSRPVIVSQTAPCFNPHVLLLTSSAVTTGQDPKTGVIREYYFGGDGPHCES